MPQPVASGEVSNTPLKCSQVLNLIELSTSTLSTTDQRAIAMRERPSLTLRAPESVPQERRSESPRHILPGLLQHEHSVVRDKPRVDTRVEQHDHATVPPSALARRPRRLLLLGWRLPASAAPDFHVRRVGRLIQHKVAKPARAKHNELLRLRW